MKKLVIGVVGVLFLVGFLIYLFYSPRLEFGVLESPDKGNKVNRLEQVDRSGDHAESPEPREGVGTWVGKDARVLTSKSGQTDRVCPFRDGYKDYVFKDENSCYIVSIKREEIASVYATGENANVSPLKIGQHSTEIFNHTNINPEPSSTVDGKKYEFEPSDEDLKAQTLIRYGNIYA